MSVRIRVVSSDSLGYAPLLAPDYARPYAHFFNIIRSLIVRHYSTLQRHLKGAFRSSTVYGSVNRHMFLCTRWKPLRHSIGCCPPRPSHVSYLETTIYGSSTRIKGRRMGLGFKYSFNEAHYCRELGCNTRGDTSTQ